jgi:hypothetical protein
MGQFQARSGNPEAQRTRLSGAWKVSSILDFTTKTKFR